MARGTLAACVVASSAVAQEPPGELDEAIAEQERLEEVVTASGMREAKATATANVTVVRWEDIQRRGYQSLAEILREVPGLHVLDDHVQPWVGVRGVTGGLRSGTRILRIMINGIPVNFRPDLSAFIGPEYLPIEVIDRVEIAKGPLSALYGANAFLATVNVITRGRGGDTPLIAEFTGRLHRKTRKTGFGGSILGGYDDKQNALMVAVSADTVDRSGLSLQRTFEAQGASPRDQGLFSEVSANDLSTPSGAYAQLASALGSNDTIHLQAGHQALDSGVEFGQNSFLTHRSRESLRNTWASLRHDRAWSSVVSSGVWAGWSTGGPGRDEVLYLTGQQDSYFKRRFTYTALDGAAEVLVRASDGFALKLGADGSYEPQTALFYSQVFNVPQGSSRPGDSVDLVAQSDETEITLSNAGAYVQATGSVGQLSIVANLRGDLPNLFPAQYSWRGALAYSWTDWLATKLIAGRAFQTPSAVLLYGLQGFGLSGDVVGNRTLTGTRPLRPQVSESVELVSSLHLSGLTVDAAAFANRVTDRVEFRYTGNSFLARNRERQQYYGGELAARLLAGRFLFSWIGAAAFVTEPDEDSPRARAYARAVALQAYPSLSTALEANVLLPELYLGLNAYGRWIGQRGATESNIAYNNDTPYALPAYATLDLKLYTVGLALFGAAQTTLSVKAQNVFDRRYSEPGFQGFDIPAFGRTFLAEARHVF